jgi:malate dehydrogenase (oxaloacetate-decarboxylating)(NADP+)
MTVAGLVSALRLTGGTLAAQRLLFLGAGEAGTGIANLFVAMLGDEKVPESDARRRCWFMDSKGLLVSSRSTMAAHSRPYAHDGPPLRGLLEAVREVRPTALIGVSGAPSTFTRPVLEEMARLNDRPIVFALSNPTSRSECTAAEAYEWTGGRAVVATGSPFGEVVIGGRRFLPGQGNNSYIFPGVGLGVIASASRRVTDEMFAAAARTLATLVGPADLELGRVFPALSRIREVSLEIATAVASVAWDRGLTDRPRPPDIRAEVASRMYQPIYPDYAAA